MKPRRRYFRNCILMTASSLLLRGAEVSLNVFVTSKVGAEGMGLLSLIGSAYGFAVTFSTSGISLAVTRMTAETVIASGGSRKRLDNIIKVTLLWCLMFGAVGSAGLYFGADYIAERLLHDARCIPCLEIMSLTLIPIALSSAMQGYFSACRRVYKNAASQFLSEAAKITACAYLLLAAAPKGLGPALEAVVLSGAVAEGLSFLVSATLFIIDRRKYYNNTAHPRAAGTEMSSDTFGDAASSLVGAALPVALSAYVRSGLVTLEHMLIPRGLEKGGADTGTALASYGVLQGMVMPVIMFPYAILGSFTSLLIPEIAERRARGERDGIDRIGSDAFRATLMFSIGMSGLFIAFSEEIGQVLYGSAEAAHYIRMIAPVIPVMYLDTAADSILKGLGEQLFCMKVNILDAGVSCVLVVLLVPAFGVAGYGVTIIVMEVVNASLSIARLISVTGIRPRPAKWVLLPLVSSVLSSCAIRLLLGIIGSPCGTAFSLGMMMVATAALYICLLFMTDSADRELVFGHT